MQQRCCARHCQSRRIGIEYVLITCDVTNIASGKVIESCGGKLRFWANQGVNETNEQ
jgi:predicted acetyltransferase